jgi:hypothetical protein
VDASPNLHAIEGKTPANGQSDGPGKDQPILSAREWHEFANLLGWFPVTATAKDSRRFEMSDGDTVMVTPRMARDIITAIEKV